MDDNERRRLYRKILHELATMRAGDTSLHSREALALIDFDEGTVTIEKTLTTIGQVSADARTMCEGARAIFARYINLDRDECLAFFDSSEDLRNLGDILVGDR